MNNVEKNFGKREDSPAVVEIRNAVEKVRAQAKQEKKDEDEAVRTYLEQRIKELEKQEKHLAEIRKVAEDYLKSLGVK